MYQLTSSREAAVNVDLVVPLDGTNGSGPKSDSGASIGVGNTPVGGQCNKHAFIFNAGDSTVGTWTLLATPPGSDTPQPVFESDGVTPVVINLATANEPLIRSLSNKPAESFTLEAAGMDGALPYSMIVMSGD